MLYEYITAECSVFEILDELDSTEVAGIDAKLTEHTVAQVILIVSKELFLLSVGSYDHLRCNLDGAIWTRLLAQCTRSTLVLAILIENHDKSTTVTLCDMLCLAVFWILLSNLAGHVLTHGDVHTRKQGFETCQSTAEI